VDNLEEKKKGKDLFRRSSRGSNEQNVRVVCLKRRSSRRMETWGWRPGGEGSKESWRGAGVVFLFVSFAIQSGERGTQEDGGITRERERERNTWI
jgi:hypothetical protein